MQGKAHISSMTGKTNLDVAKRNASDIGQTMDILSDLKIKRRVKNDFYKF